MFNREKKTLMFLAVLALLLNSGIVNAAEEGIASVGADVLPINVANPSENEKTAAADKATLPLVSPTKANLPNEGAHPATAEEPKPATANAASQNEKQQPAEVKQENNASVASAAAPVGAPAANEKNEASPVAKEKAEKDPAPVKDDFDFDLKMKSINTPAAPNIAAMPQQPAAQADTPILTDEDLPKAIQYKTNPIDNLGNNILSQMDDDLFSQMSEIEKSTTLLTLELRREKIRNEIEAQKAIRQRAADDLEQKKREAKLKEFEKKKQIEAKVLQEKQLLLDKQQMLEILKQKKLLNAYMNHMLVNQQDWLKEKENLYAQLAAAEQEKKELTDLFKTKVEKLVDVSVKNMQAAEAAKANFDRVVKSLKARNEQLRKRIEADAKIIKNAQKSLYLKSQSIEELQNKNATLPASAQATATQAQQENAEAVDVGEEVEIPVRLSAQYAILGITGRADNMVIDVIDVNGQPISLKIGSTLPSGHVLKEIGSDYALFSRNGIDEYLYVGRTIDGIIPTLGLAKDKK